MSADSRVSGAASAVSVGGIVYLKTSRRHDVGTVVYFYDRGGIVRRVTVTWDAGEHEGSDGRCVFWHMCAPYGFAWSEASIHTQESVR